MCKKHKHLQEKTNYNQWPPYICGCPKKGTPKRPPAKSTPKSKPAKPKRQLTYSQTNA